MRTILIAALLVTPATLALLPSAQATCFQGSNPNGNTFEIISLGAVNRPEAGIWVEQECYPFTAHDGSEDQANVGVTYDDRASPRPCQFVPQVRVLEIPVPGTNAEYCSPTGSTYVNQEFPSPVIGDTGLLICLADASSCVWISPALIVYRCKLAEPDPLQVTVPGAVFAEVSCEAV